MANNSVWYYNVFKHALRRSSTAEEIVESDMFDWRRLRYVRNGKLVPAMKKGHIGEPTEAEIEELRNEARNGKGAN